MVRVKSKTAQTQTFLFFSPSLTSGFRQGVTHRQHDDCFFSRRFRCGYFWLYLWNRERLWLWRGFVCADYVPHGPVSGSVIRSHFQAYDCANVTTARRCTASFMQDSDRRELHLHKLFSQSRFVVHLISYVAAAACIPQRRPPQRSL